MTDAELRAGIRAELIHNIITAPVVLLVRLPLGLIWASLDGIKTALEWVNDRLPGWKNDYIRYWIAQRNRP